ncbi:MAG: histone deacetylase family protein [Woeseiaceae bacterium]|jgi:acetoin utilization deacetylase AcuC-like enzyme|nr:histone deacetylase family protein [Woeseiaceae bacterium]TFG41470.1 MAG: histone deacetylase family protein [Chromatiales bacterium]
MLTIYSDDHRLHHGKSELNDGELKPCFECPERADIILDAVTESKLGDVIAPDNFGLDPIRAVHNPGYVAFLEQAWNSWTATGRHGDALPLNWAIRGLRQIEPETIDGKLSYFSFDASTPITAGTWKAATSAANVALTGAANLLQGESCAFSLCRPPGHHAASDYFGGYCFLNNAAIATQYLLDHGATRVAVLDVDYHHGNGTQSIFYERSDVLFVSIHADPLQEYPFFLGHVDERGDGAGEGYTANFPLRWHSSAPKWFDALDAGLQLIADYAPDYVVISLGVDTYIDDPISQFRLETPDYLEVGSRIASLGLPMLFVLEGGYAVAEVGRNVSNVLVGAAAGN